jgi:hypothetical protein
MTTDMFTTNTISTSMMSGRLWENLIAIRIVMNGWCIATLTTLTYIIDMPIRSYRPRG